MNRVICWGATGHAAVLREALRRQGQDLAVLVDNRRITSPFNDLRCLHGDAELAAWERQREASVSYGAVIAIGGGRGSDRLAIQLLLVNRGYDIVEIRHSTAFIADDVITGIGCQILAMSAVCARTRIGDAVIVNTRASVDHDCHIGNGVHIGPGATLAGAINVGDRAFIGAGATVLPHLSIGADAVVGAGAVVTRNVAPRTTVVGVPAVPHHSPDFRV